MIWPDEASTVGVVDRKKQRAKRKQKLVDLATSYAGVEQQRQLLYA